jgi:chemotaxis signal transduction protein
MAPRETLAPRAVKLVLPLQLGDVWIAIEPGYVQELIGARAWMRVPGASPHLPGILAWRSHAIAVLDLRALLGIAVHSTTPPPRTVVARVADCTFAFFVDVAREVRAVDEAAFKLPHAVTGSYVTHELSLDGRVMPVIDLAAVIEGVAGVASERA